MKKRLLCSLPCLLLLALLCTLPAMAAGGLRIFIYDYTAKAYLPSDTAAVQVTLDGEALPCDVPAFIYKVDGDSGRAMVPLRVISENLGATVDWLAEENQISIRAGSTTILLTPGSPTAIVNGSAALLPDGVSATVASYRQVDRTMVPVRFVSELLNAKVEWDQATYTVAITSPAPDDTNGAWSPLDPGSRDTTVPPAEDNNTPAQPDAPDDTKGDTDPGKDPAAPETPEEPDAPSDTPLDPANTVIFLDAGHGGTDPGAMANGVQESLVNLSVTLQAAALLEDAGYQVRLTRTDETYLTLKERVRLANEGKASIFVSIHSNSATSASVYGITTYYCTGSSGGKVLARTVHAALLDAAGGHDRGVDDNVFYVIRYTDMPAILIELGFLTNKNEAALLADPDYQTRLAAGVAAGIQAYFALPIADRGLPLPGDSSGKEDETEAPLPDADALEEPAPAA